MSPLALESAPPELRRFARETRPDPLTVEALHRRLRWAPAAPLRRPRLAFAWAPLVLAALVLSLLRPTAPRSLDAPIAREVRLSVDVRLDVQGQGEAGGPPHAPRIRWTWGHLSAEVTPHQGIDLRVLTPEAEVRVVGTVFSVERDALGTRVAVQRGEVEVRCAGVAPVRIAPGEALVCPPTTAAGALGRARALQAADAPTQDVLAAVGRGETLAPDPAVAVELRWVRVEALLAGGRLGDAQEAARDALALGGGHRAEDLRAVIR